MNTSWFTPENICYDWQHVYLEGGLLDVELGMMFAELDRHRLLKLRDFGDCVANFTWPKWVGAKPRPEVLFTDKEAKKIRKTEAFKAQCSEILSFAPVLRLFLLDMLESTPDMPTDAKACRDMVLYSRMHCPIKLHDFRGTRRPLYTCVRAGVLGICLIACLIPSWASHRTWGLGVWYWGRFPPSAVSEASWGRSWALYWMGAVGVEECRTR